MKAFVFKIFASILILAALISILEFGFYLRASGADEPKTDEAKGGGRRVLLIGDSVLGVLGESKTLANEIRSAWLRIEPGATFDEINKSGLLTDEAVQALPEKLKSFKPDIALIMIGRSDYGREGEADSAWLVWISKLRVGRFARLLIRDFEGRIHVLLTKGTSAAPSTNSETISRHDQLFAPPWKLYGELKYDEATPLFETALREKPQYENGIRALYLCYIKTGEFKRGVEFFKELQTSSRHRSLLDVYVASLRIRSGEDRTKIKLSLDSIEGARLAFKTRMWFLMSQNDDREFRRLLETLTVAENAPRIEKAVRGIQRIASDLTDAGVKTVFLSYPTDHVDQLRSELKGFESVRVLDTRSYVLQAPPPTYLYIEEDIEHLTQVATPLVASQIVDALK